MLYNLSDNGQIKTHQTHKKTRTKTKHSHHPHLPISSDPARVKNLDVAFSLVGCGKLAWLQLVTAFQKVEIR